MSSSGNYDVIVVGAGHAGCEAALAAARMGCKTLLLTISLDALAYLPCDCMIGGPERGQLVREIDALGGEMAKAVDRTYLHKRQARVSKDIAVQMPLGIVDKREYFLNMKHTVERQPNLKLKQALVTGITRANESLKVETKFGQVYEAKTVVLATGTFLGGRVILGGRETSSGRHAEVPSVELSRSLKELGFRLGRFKISTSPQVARGSISLSNLSEQKPDKNPVNFSLWQKAPYREQLDCYVTATSKKTHRIIEREASRASLTYFGKGKGSRHCFSIEEKVLNFLGEEKHPIFIQPTGRRTSEMYLQGLSTGLSEAIQFEIVHSIEGLEQAEIMRPGYAVEYDYIVPDQLEKTLETKSIKGLFTAGQINGTSGYEEAAAQGIIAGINAALKAKGEPPFILDRSEAYIGVLIDDLVTKGVDEPYRMFTSRAEYRLLLRSDNADLRLTPKGYKLGLISEEQLRRVEEKRSQ